MMRIRRFAICVTLLSSHAALATSVCDAQWQLATIRQLDGSSAVALPALRQDVSEGWNRIAQIPYMVYLPERDRIVMLLDVDTPLPPPLPQGETCCRMLQRTTSLRQAQPYAFAVVP